MNWPYAIVYIVWAILAIVLVVALLTRDNHESKDRGKTISSVTTPTK